ncbi:MAG: AAA family ATPase [Bifidobacteriaceae bacterium]|jgi:MinD-like ATPase involved in chromosome partitioning or flagellar assembly|nr:AAA family ATPase [Bifidobacteriaceae bacterium]
MEWNIKIADDLCFDRTENPPNIDSFNQEPINEPIIQESDTPKHLSENIIIPEIPNEQNLKDNYDIRQYNFNVNSNLYNQNIVDKKRGKTIAIVGAKGGIGTTLFSICLSLYLSKTNKTALVDAQAGGGGLDIALGLESKEGIRICDLVNADGKIPAERLFTQAIDYSGLKVISSSYTNPIFPEDRIFVNILDQLKTAADITILDTPRDRLANSNFLKTLDNLVIICSNDIQGLSGASAISNLANGINKHIIVHKLHSFKNIKLFQNNEIQRYLNADILGQIKIDPYIKTSLESGMQLDIKKNSEISKLCERVHGALQC